VIIGNFASAASLQSNLLENLSKAEDYLFVKPSISSSLLKEHLVSVKKLPTQDQLRWHQTLLRASIALNDLVQIEKTARTLLTYSEISQETDKLVSLLSGLGIFMRRLGHHNESIWLFKCGLKQPNLNAKQQLSLLLSKGISLRQLGELVEADVIYDQALELAILHDEKIFESAIRNTIGILALYQHDLSRAKKYFVKSMQISQQILRRSGHVIAGLNLLMVSVLEKDPTLYKRLHSRIRRLTLAGINKDRHLFVMVRESP
jgi:tetratricopeptide (TPR) repeat protein